jgi:hypothetical protein
VDVRVGNVNRVMEGYIHDWDAYCKTNGYAPITVSIYVVNSLNITSTVPEVDHVFDLIQPRTDSMWATFTLGANNPFMRRYPWHRIMKMHCRHVFKDDNCGYAGVTSTCDKTLTACRAMNGGSNSARFGGSLGVGASGIRLA